MIMDVSMWHGCRGSRALVAVAGIGKEGGELGWAVDGGPDSDLLQVLRMVSQ